MGTLEEKNWGGRIVHLNMKLITCKYNANDMQTSPGFLGVHSLGIFFLGLRIGANLHPVHAQCLDSLLLIFSEGEHKASLVKEEREPMRGWSSGHPGKGRGPPLPPPTVASGKLTCLSDSEGAE